MMASPAPEYFPHFSDAQEFLATRAGGKPLDYSRDNPKTMLAAIMHGVGAQVKAAIQLSREMDPVINESVRRAEQRVVKRTPAETSTSPAVAGEWSEPRPLAVAIASLPYPLEAFPAAIRSAICEVQAFVKAPAPMVAGSALAAVSVVAQALVDVRRTPTLEGPVSLYLLTIADSGERKTTCDGYFTKPIKEWLRERSIAEQPNASAGKAEWEAWSAKMEGLKDSIRANAKKGDMVAAEQDKTVMLELARQKPKPYKYPRLLRGEDTPEKLALALMNEWPSCGVISSEGGVILGGHGMGRDTIMRNLSQYNVFWDGGSISRGRVTTESVDVRGARVTLALQIQEPMLRAFFARSEGLARGSGFLARFLLAWPSSTQGTRAFTEAPAAWPAMSAFNRRLVELLDEPVTLTEDGALTPTMLDLSTEAKVHWIAFSDAIEKELGTSGELQDVRDIASKTADNAVRMAALFHVFDGGPRGQIGLEAMRGACRIVSWHLNESRRFIGGVEIPAELVNASRLDAWLLDYCQRRDPAEADGLAANEVHTRTVYQLGPSAMRDKFSVAAAVTELEEQGRARIEERGRVKLIAINPRLLEGAR